MPERAKVTSLEAIESFRAKLIIYRSKAASLLDEIGEDVTRTRLWLQTDRTAFWQQQIRKRNRELEQRQQELFSARLSQFADSTPALQQAVHKARQAVRDAEEKLSHVKHWQRQFDQRVEPLGRQVDKLRHHFDHDLVLAVAYLDDMIQTLSAYADMSPTGAAPTKPAEAANDSNALPPAGDTNP